MKTKKSISVVIPTLNSAGTLATKQDISQFEKVLQLFNKSDLVFEVIISDGGSIDSTLDIAKKYNTRIVQREPGRGLQLKVGALESSEESPWFLFCHSDTLLGEGWEGETERFIKEIESKKTETAAAYCFALNAEGIFPQIMEVLVYLRSKILALPYGDQCLLIKKEHYQKVGGFKKIPLMEDVDIIRRIGYWHIHIFKSKAITDAEKFERGGYIKRPFFNLRILLRYYLGVKPEILVKRYYK